jgi:hypothetical protein
MFPDARELEARIAEFKFYDQKELPLVPDDVGRMRLAEMAAETRAVLNSDSFAWLIDSSVDACFHIMFEQLKTSFKTKAAMSLRAPINLAALQAQNAQNASLSSSDQSTDSSNASTSSTQSETAFDVAQKMPFANAMIRMTKLFGNVLPATPQELTGSQTLQLLNNLQAMKDLCSIIYYPNMEAPRINPEALQTGALSGLPSFDNL